MKDRIPEYPGRVKLIPVPGQDGVYDLVRADNPTEAGTPLNKATFLKDTTAALYGMGADAVPDDVFQAISEDMKHSFQNFHYYELLESGEVTFGDDVLDNEVWVLCCGGGGGGGHSGNSSFGGGGGGGGHIALQKVTITPGKKYSAIIGAGGAGATNTKEQNDGGVTSFAGVVANGGAGGLHGKGGDGGAGGGGAYTYAGGNGSFGGGGGSQEGKAGNGGPYGGGGGTATGTPGNGGLYGGNGGAFADGEKGTPGTIPWFLIHAAIEKQGFCGSGGHRYKGSSSAAGGGGGGYGGNGGDGFNSASACGGGGGFCADGGSAKDNNGDGGGGGGFFSDGGSTEGYGGGGGGGYFGKGGDAKGSTIASLKCGTRGGGGGGSGRGNDYGAGDGGDGVVAYWYFSTKNVLEENS